MQWFLWGLFQYFLQGFFKKSSKDSIGNYSKICSMGSSKIFFILFFEGFLRRYLRKLLQRFITEWLLWLLLKFLQRFFQGATSINLLWIFLRIASAFPLSITTGTLPIISLKGFTRNSSKNYFSRFFRGTRNFSKKFSESFPRITDADGKCRFSSKNFVEISFQD